MQCFLLLFFLRVLRRVSRALSKTWANPLFSLSFYLISIRVLQRQNMGLTCVWLWSVFGLVPRQGSLVWNNFGTTDLKEYFQSWDWRTGTGPGFIWAHPSIITWACHDRDRTTWFLWEKKSMFNFGPNKTMKTDMDDGLSGFPKPNNIEQVSTILTIWLLWDSTPCLFVQSWPNKSCCCQLFAR